MHTQRTSKINEVRHHDGKSVFVVSAFWYRFDLDFSAEIDQLLAEVNMEITLRSRYPRKLANY